MPCFDLSKKVWIISIALLLTASPVSYASAKFYGAEPNNSGNPIGGGYGYSDILSSGEADYVVDTKEELLNALSLAIPGTIIYVEDVANIDLSSETNILIPQGVVLASGRGRNGSEGALLYSRRPSSFYMFATNGDSIRITGLRIHGPFPGQEQLTIYARGVYITHSHIEIDNCELLGFNHAAVITEGSGAVDFHYHHNYVHHCQQSGLGYGSTSNESESLIEGNLYDFCRHAIAGTGRWGTKYEARYNIHLEHTIGHVFDMHGERDFDKYILVALWHFDEGSGILTDDYSIYNNDHDGLLYNMAPEAWVSGRINYGLEFDGLDDYVDFGNDWQLSPADKMSLCAWIKPYNVIGIQAIFSKGDVEATGSGYSLRLNNNKLEAAIYDTNGNRQSNSYGTVSSNIWHYVAMTYGSNTVKVYLDGSLAGSFTCAGMKPSDYHLIIGREAASATGQFNGIIDEARFYKDEIQEKQINYHYNGVADVAGDVIKVHHNTFRPTNYPAVRVRGRPETGCWVNNNWFYEQDNDTVVEQINARGNMFISNNLYGIDSLPPDPSQGTIYAKWLFDEGSGSIIKDSSTYGNDGTLTNMDTDTCWVEHSTGTALQFDGDDDYVNVPGSSSISISDNIAIDLWLKFHTLGENEYYFDNGLFYLFLRGAWAGNRIYFLCRIAEAESPGISSWNYKAGVRTESEVTTETWYHIVGMRQGDTMKIFLDGALESELDCLSGYTVDTSNTTSLKLGSDLHGMIDGVQMYSLPELAGGTAHLDWTGETNYVLDGVNPEEGISTTPFVFRIKYTNSANIRPAVGFPRVHILKNGVPYIDKAPVSMMAVNSNPFTIGRIYQYSMMLPEGSDYSYYFEAEDANGNTTKTASINGPEVGDITPPLSPPCEYDFNQDGDVDGSDLTVFLLNFIGTEYSPDHPNMPNFDNYNKDADFFDDGCVDDNDLKVFGKNFGQICFLREHLPVSANFDDGTIEGFVMPSGGYGDWTVLQPDGSAWTSGANGVLWQTEGNQSASGGNGWWYVLKPDVASDNFTYTALAPLPVMDNCASDLWCERIQISMASKS